MVWILGTREQTRLDFCLQSLTVKLLAVDLGHLDTPHLGDIGALLAGGLGGLAAQSFGNSLAVGLGDVLAFFLLHGLALPLE